LIGGEVVDVIGKCVAEDTDVFCGVAHRAGVLVGGGFTPGGTKTGVCEAQLPDC
jgi:hypothetical protein